MAHSKYSQAQYDSFKEVVHKFRKKSYSELKVLADKKFNDTVHPRDDVQIGIDVLYDDKKLEHIRCSVALYTFKELPWWHFWDSAVLVESFVIAPDGTYIGE